MLKTLKKAAKKSSWTRTHNIKSAKTFAGKTAYQHHGVLLQNEEGHIRILLNSIPAGSTNSNGELMLFVFPHEPKEEE
jgi:hypothetical protein